MKLRNLFGFLVKQPKRLPEPCPICRKPMKREGFVRYCPTGHRFRDRRSTDALPNQGDHHGAI